MDKNNAALISPRLPVSGPKTPFDQMAVSAVVVVLSGLLAGLMSISTDLQSFIWLPSGVALAVALWFGMPGIIGAGIGGGVIGWMFASGQGVATYPLLVVTLSSALGAAAEAWIGRLLVKRFIGPQAEVESTNALFRLSLLSPLIALVNPSVVVAMQSLGGAGIWDDYWLLWSNMWLAGAIAIALLTPLLLALTHRTPVQMALLAAVMVAGTWLSYSLVISTSNQARAAWESIARDEANQLTGLFVRALQNGFGDMRAMALAVGGDGELSVQEFKSAVTALHQSSEGFAPAALLIVARDENGDWIAEHSSDTELGLSVGTNMSAIDVARDAINASLERGLVLGATTELVPGQYFGVNAIPVSNGDRQLVVVGIQDVQEIDRIVAEQITPGLGFAISSVHASGRTTEGRDHHYPEGKSSADAVAQFTVPVEIAGATLTFQWGVIEQYLGGPALRFSRLIFFAGPLVTLLVALAINILFAQSRRIRRQVDIKTAELRTQKEIADQALENMGEGILLVDGNGEIAAYNQLGAQYFGLTDEEIARYPRYEDLLAYLFLEKYDQPESYEQRMKELRDNKGLQIDRELPNGKVLEVRHRPLDDGGFVRMFLDVTDNRKAAKELERQTTIANMALENMDEGLLMVGGDGSLLACNKVALDLSFTTREEFERFGTYEALVRHVHTEKLNTPQYIDRLLEEARATEPTIMEREHPSGSIIETRHMPMSDGGFVRMFTDVTERKRAAAELEEQTAMLDLALRSMDEGLMLVNGEGQIKAWNDNALETFKIDDETMRGFDNHDELLRYLHLTNLGSLEHFEEDRTNMSSNKAWVMEREVPDGTVWQSRYYPLEDGGFIVLYNDVTQRRADEHELVIARQIAEDSAKSKSEFLANMSHEIRTPMNAIIGMSQLALKSDLTAKQHNYIDKVNRSAVGLLGIINDILDFSKIEAGKLEMEEVDFRLEEVLDNLVTLVGFRAEEKGLELLLDVDADVPRQLRGDPLRLGQILVNLANNAVKFTEQGEVVVSVTSVQRDPSTVELAFSVRDTGIGMTVEEKARLFKAFSQADASTTRKFGGTGLGLTISKRLVDAMGGEIKVDSKPDMGSEFRFTVKLGWSEDAIALPTAADLALDRLRVLVVDDNPTARTIFTELVGSLGFRVDLADSGQAALDMAQAALDAGDPYEVLLVDWQMPHMDGVETVRAMVDRGLHPDAQTVLMVTAYGREEASEAGQGLPINSILTKPLNASMLLDAILMAQGREALSHRMRQSGDTPKEYAGQLAGAHVLLVEDNDINQELATELLQQAGIRVDVANHGREALDRLNETTYDGVLMDIQMPVMDGYTATERIRQQERFADLPVIAMTANALVGDRERALEVGMNDHIAKPLNVSTMFATMAKWISPSQPGSAPVSAPEKKDESAPGSVPEIVGVNTRAGLATCGGKQDLYLKLLRKFRDSNQQFDQQYADAQEDADADAPRRLAHTLKGTSASIGAAEVSQAAAALEAADESNRDECLKAVTESLAPVLEALAQADWLQASSAAPSTGEGVGDGAVRELRELLANADTRAAQQVETMLGTATDAQRQSLSEIAQNIEMFDFDAALARLEALAT